MASSTAAIPISNRRDAHVLIIGAGVTGCLVAQGLKKAGIAYSIFESESTASRPRTREWGMSIHWSRPLLEQLLPEDILARLREAAVDPSFDSSEAGGYLVPFYNGKTGEHIIDMPMKNAIRVSRRKMRKLCSEGLDIKYGEKLVSVSHSNDDGVTAVFESGTAATGTIVIGTDGPQSTVRKILLGDKAPSIPLDVVLYNVNVCYGDAERASAVRKLHPMNTVALQPDKGLSVWTSIQDVPDPKKPETWVFQLMPTWLNDGKIHSGGAEGLAELKEIAKDLAEPWRSSILWIPDGTEISPNSVSYWITSPWDNQGGTITLAGDAAHPLPPHRGQGLNHCIADVKNFVQAMVDITEGRTTAAEAITAYDEELVKRGSEEVETSRKNALLVHNFEKFMDSPVLKHGYVRGQN